MSRAYRGALATSVTEYVRFEHAGNRLLQDLGDDRVKELEGDVFGEPTLTGREVPVSQVGFLVPCEPSKEVAVG